MLYNMTSHKFAAKTLLPAVFGFLQKQVKVQSSAFWLLFAIVKTDSTHAAIDVRKLLADAGLCVYIPV